LDFIGTAAEVHATPGFDDTDCAVINLFCESFHCLFKPKVFFLFIVEMVKGAADWAGDGLGMVSSIFRVFVFLGAIAAEVEFVHRGAFPVIWDIRNEAVTGTADGAVGERVMVSSIRGFEEFTEALIADAYVWGNRRLFFPMFTFNDTEIRECSVVWFLYDVGDFCNAGEIVL